MVLANVNWPQLSIMVGDETISTMYVALTWNSDGAGPFPVPPTPMHNTNYIPTEKDIVGTAAWSVEGSSSTKGSSSTDNFSSTEYVTNTDYT